MVDLEQRVRASEAREGELKAKLANLEQRTAASDAKEREYQVFLTSNEDSSGTDLERLQATIDELRVQLADLERTPDAELRTKFADLEEDQRKTKKQLEETEAEHIKWMENANALDERIRLLRERCKVIKPKADAWDANVEYLSTAMMIEVLGEPQNYLNNCRVKTPMEKMTGIATLAGITVEASDTYAKIRKQVLLKTHPDKRQCTAEYVILYEKICLAATNLPVDIK